jgi:hypothetical protein
LGGGNGSSLHFFLLFIQERPNHFTKDLYIFPSLWRIGILSVACESRLFWQNMGFFWLGF